MTEKDKITMTKTLCEAFGLPEKAQEDLMKWLNNSLAFRQRPYCLECETCKKGLDEEVEPTTQCSVCKNLFCCNLHKDCHSKHRCVTCRNATAETITNPGWIMNLKQSNES